MDTRYSAVCLFQRGLGISRTAALSLLLAISCVAAHAERPFRVRGRDNFYAGQRGEAGRIGFLPNINDADNAYSAISFLALEDWGSYELRRQSRYCFVLNNRTGDDGVTTFLGVRVVLVFSAETPMDKGVLLGRNRGWTRRGDQDFSNVRSERFVPNLSIEDFAKLHEGAHTLLDADKRFDFKWHGSPVGSNSDSWLTRDALISPFKQWSLISFLQRFEPKLRSVSDTKEKLSCLLLKFQTTSKSAPDRPLAFDFARFSAQSAVITTFCPDDSRFDKTWRVVFTK